MRTTSLVLILTFVFASTAFLLPAASAQSNGAIEGTVCSVQDYGYPTPMMNSKSGYECSQYGQGIPSATLTLTKPGLGGTPVAAFSQTTTSDDRGSFRFSGLEAGNYTLRTERKGFDINTTTVSVSSSISHRDVVLAGQKVAVSGKVVDSASAAVAKGEIHFCCSPDEVTVTSGADGSFSANVKAGWHSISIQASGFQYWGEYRFIDGTALGNIVLERVPPTDATIRGTVRDQTGNPVEGVRISAYTYNGCGYSEPAKESSSDAPRAMPVCEARPYNGGENFTTSDAQGKYVLGVYSGEGNLNIQKDGFAGYNMGLRITAGEDRTHDFTIKKFPEKTAHIIGKITDAGKPVRFASLSVSSPEFGVYECSMETESGSSTGTAKPSNGAETSIAPSPYNRGCAITMKADGTFEGTVTPGYSILSVYVDSYRACSETRDADGSSSRTCGPEYYSWSRSMDLPADATTRVDIALRARPEANAVVSGYLIDAETGKALVGAHISFSNADTYGYGYATTDKDGSYKISLRAGYHNVYASAPDHLRWEGVLDIAKGNTPFDIKLVPGQESWGGCCSIAYSEDSAGGKSSPPAPSQSGVPVGSSNAPVSDTREGSTSVYTDLGGGLGPYNAASRDRQLQGDDNGAPAPGLILALAALVGTVLVLRRRKQ